jgi:hypothetical protein
LAGKINRVANGGDAFYVHVFCLSRIWKNAPFGLA